MQEGTLQYLREVLGIREVLVPATDKAAHALMIITDRVQSPEQTELVQKMLAALQVKDFYWVEREGDWQQKVQAHTGTHVICFGQGEMLESVSSQWITAPTLEELCDHANPTQTKELKTRLWEKIKNLKGKI